MSSWKLVWSDEFDGPVGTLPDPAKWGYEIGGGGWGNAELQYYTDRAENAALDGNGSLVITAKTEDPSSTPYRCLYGSCMYSSARLLTKGKFEFTYGRVEARIKIPSTQGLWPAFWMLGSNINTKPWPSCGEIDILENIGKEPTTVYGTIHGPGYAGSAGPSQAYTQTVPFADDYHVYAVEWEPDRIAWYVDGNLYGTFFVSASSESAIFRFDPATNITTVVHSFPLDPITGMPGPDGLNVQRLALEPARLPRDHVQGDLDVAFGAERVQRA